MAKLNVSIEQVKGAGEATVIIKFTNDVDKHINDVDREHIIRVAKEMFEVEMFSADIASNKGVITITLVTENMEKLERLRKGMARTFRERSDMPAISNN